MTGPLRWKGFPLASALAFCAFAFVAKAFEAHSPIPLLGAIPAGLWAVSWVEEWVSRKLIRSSWVVYMLRTNTGQVLYVGETNDVYGRALRHPTETQDAWRRDIRTSKVVRYCRNDKQAKRCEARRIRALVKASEKAFGPPLNNDVWAKPSSDHTRNAAAFVWSKLYRVQSIIWADCCWHRPLPPLNPDAVIDPTQTTGRWDLDDPEPDSDDPEDDPYGPLLDSDDDRNEEPAVTDDPLPSRREGSDANNTEPVTSDAEPVTADDQPPKASGSKPARRTPRTNAQRQADYRARRAAKQKEAAQ